MQEKIALVVPCFNEAARLDYAAFKKRPQNIYLFFVDDGSHDTTAANIQSQLCDDSTFLLKLDSNRGKAEAVRAGMLHIIARADLPSFGWIGYWDADLATPLSEVENLARFSANFNESAKMVMGSRIKRGGSQVQRRLSRHILGRIFCTVVALWLKLDRYYDTQCGAKLFRRSAVMPLFGEPFISRWLFDIELLLRLNDSEALEYPLQVWAEKAGSKLKISRSLFKFARELWQIKRKARHLRPAEAFSN